MRVVFWKELIQNTVEDGDDDDNDLSGFLLRLATSCAALGGSCIIDFHHWWYSPRRYSPTCLHYSPFTTCRRTQRNYSAHPETARGLCVMNECVAMPDVKVGCFAGVLNLSDKKLTFTSIVNPRSLIWLTSLKGRISGIWLLEKKITWYTVLLTVALVLVWGPSRSLRTMCGVLPHNPKLWVAVASERSHHIQ